MKMKAISLSLISSIIFSIVLAENCSDLEPTTGCIEFCRKKQNKTHTTTDDPINVEGKGPYEEDYEEDYEDMIKDIFMPLKSNYQYRQNNSHKQGDAPSPVSKGVEKQEFTEERKLSTINEKDSYDENVNDENENDEIYQKHKNLLCTDPEETKQAEKLMNEAVEHLEYHATSKDGYEPYERGINGILSYYKKKHENHTDVLKANYKFYDSDQVSINEQY